MVKNPQIIIQARMNSERLPGKVMKRINGKPLIGILIERLKKAKIPITLATSINNENDELVDYVQNLGVTVFRGSEDNVLKRYYLAAKKLNADLIIRVTGDNPLMDGKLIRDTYLYYLTQNERRLYMSIGLSQTYPLGISASLFPFKLLQEAYENATHPGEFEHVTPYIANNVPGDITIKSFSADMNKYHYRLTVDTEQDFNLHKILIERFSCDKLDVNEIVDIIDKNPELHNLNSNIRQKRWND